MLNCPKCGTPAERHSGQGGLIWNCPHCGGASSTISRMRKVVPRDVVNSLWNAAKSGKYPQTHTCPSCNHPLTEVPVPGETFAIDICTCCAFVWFDSGEYQCIPHAEKKKQKPGCAELNQRMALYRVEQIRRNAWAEKESPDEAWKYIPALLGAPVEFDCEQTRCIPYATYILTAIVIITSLLGFMGILTPARFGLVPTAWSRMAGLTFFTCFFLHGGPLHLLGNLYYLYVFGDNVEDFLGRGRFLLLLALSTLCGGLLYVLTRPDSTVACIGASGGISGILAYYALRFPKHRIGFLIFFVKWIRFPVVGYFAFWVLLQLYGEISGAGRVAYMAHIGGMLAGVLFWLTERSLERRS